MFREKRVAIMASHHKIHREVTMVVTCAECGESMDREKWTIWAEVCRIEADKST